MYEDDEFEFEEMSDTEVETASNVETVEEQRGLASAGEIATSLEDLQEHVAIEDALGLFSEEPAEVESDIEAVDDSVEQTLNAVRRISSNLQKSDLHMVGDALEELLNASANDRELQVILEELISVLPLSDSPDYTLSFQRAYAYEWIWGVLHDFSHYWHASWFRTLSETRYVLNDEERIETLRTLASAFEIWPWKWPWFEAPSTLERNLWISIRHGRLLTEIDAIESGFWRARGLKELAQFTQTVRSTNSERSIELGLELYDRFLDLERQSGWYDDQARVRAFKNLNLRLASYLSIPPQIEDVPVSTAPSETIPPIDITSNLEPTGPRYSDFLFYYDDKFAIGPRVPNTDPLRAGIWYQLEVAIRVKPIGIPFAESKEFPERRELSELNQKEPVTIWVTVQPDLPDDPAIEIEEPVQTLTLPPIGDSTQHAYFRVRCLSPSASQLDLAKFKVSLYYEFNLIEIALIQAEVIALYLDPPKSQLGLPKPISFIQLALPREYVDFDNISPRSMNIRVSKRGEKYVFSFLFENAEKAKVGLFAPISLNTADLSDALFNIRKLCYQTALSPSFQKGLVATEPEFTRYVRKLAQAGRRVWNGLFKRKTKGGTSSIYKVCEWLESHPLPNDSVIQISFESNADNFVLPWSLLYDRTVPRDENKLPDTDGFWGMRYRIEQQIPDRKYRTDEPIVVPDKMDFGFMVWDQFRNINNQKTLLTNFGSRSLGKLQVSTPPISDPLGCYELLKNGRPHIIYFYSHGHTRIRQADIGVGTDFQIFIDYYKKLKKNDPLRKTLYYIYKSVKSDDYEPDRSWIGLTGGKVYLDELEDELIKLQSQPLVILNMCESAQITPSLSDSFINFFLDRGAESVIGTECPMTIEFAHPFAEKFLTGILTGESVGKALLDTRRHFMNQKNPLGLAYTLFGSAASCFTPPRF